MSHQPERIGLGDWRLPPANHPELSFAASIAPFLDLDTLDPAMKPDDDSLAPYLGASEIKMLPNREQRMNFLFDHYLPNYAGCILPSEKLSDYSRLAAWTQGLTSMLAAQALWDAETLANGWQQPAIAKRDAELKTTRVKAEQVAIRNRWQSKLDNIEAEISASGELLNVVLDAFIMSFVTNSDGITYLYRATTELAELSEDPSYQAAIYQQVEQLIKRATQRLQDKHVQVGDRRGDIPTAILTYKEQVDQGRNVMSEDPNHTLTGLIDAAFAEKTETPNKLTEPIREMALATLDRTLTIAPKIGGVTEKTPHLALTYDLLFLAGVSITSFESFKLFLEWFLNRITQKDKRNPSFWDQVQKEFSTALPLANQEQVKLCSSIIQQYGAPSQHQDPAQLAQWFLNHAGQEVGWMFNKGLAHIGVMTDRALGMMAFVALVQAHFGQEFPGFSDELYNQVGFKLHQSMFLKPREQTLYVDLINTVNSLGQAAGRTHGYYCLDGVLIRWNPDAGDRGQSALWNDEVRQKFLAEMAGIHYQPYGTEPEVQQAEYLMMKRGVIEALLESGYYQQSLHSSEQLQALDQQVSELKTAVNNRYTHFLSWRGDAFSVANNPWLAQHYIEQILFKPIMGKAGSYFIAVTFSPLGQAELRTMEFVLNNKGRFTWEDGLTVSTHKEYELAFQRTILQLLNYITSGQAFADKAEVLGQGQTEKDQPLEQQGSTRRSHWRFYRNGWELNSATAVKHREQVWDRYGIDTDTERARRIAEGAMTLDEYMTFVQESDSAHGEPNQFVFRG